MGGSIAEFQDFSNFSLHFLNMKRKWAFLRGLVALPGVRREELFEFVFYGFKFFGFWHWLLFAGDIWPFLSIFSVHFKIFLTGGVGIRYDSFNRAFRFADATVNAFVRMDDQSIFPS